MQLSAEKVNVNIEEGTVIITGYDIDEIVAEVGTKELLEAMDYSDVMQFVTDAERDKKEDSDYRNALDSLMGQPMQTLDSLKVLS